jgi:alpha-L-fucosidase
MRQRYPQPLHATWSGLFAVLLATPGGHAATSEVAGQHAQIGVIATAQSGSHTQHADAQWFPEAGLGLFLHWDIGSVRYLETSWPMIAGTGLSWARPPRVIRDDPAEFARIVREQDYNLDGRRPQITPNGYWALAKEFNPTNFHPEVWLKKAKAAGFKYAVLTTKHHNGFALWPSAFGGFNTKDTPMNGRDLVKEYVEACRAAGLKVGFYFSGPDWHFDRAFMNYIYGGSAAKYRGKLPELGPDHEPRVVTRTAEEIAAHHAALKEMVCGQIEELLTRYGKIDVMWFDGGPSHPERGAIFPLERIRALQPGIVVNPRFHGRGDFITPEGHLPEGLHLKADEWGELCSCWAGSWSYTRRPYRPFSDVIGELVRCRAAGINNLLDIGPMADGNLEPAAYENMEKLEAWMKVNGEAVHGTRALPGPERASVPAAAKGPVRYLYLLPGKSGEAGPHSVTISGLRGPDTWRARLLGDEQSLSITATGDFSHATPEPTLLTTSPSGHAGSGPEPLAGTTDGNTATKWCFGHGKKFPIIWQAEVVGARPPVTAYALTSAGDMPDRDPAAWRFLGSPDGVAWTVLDERRDEPAWEQRNARREFAVTNTTAYAHYRFEFTAVHNECPMFQLAEISLLPPPVVGGTLTVLVPQAPPAAGVRVVRVAP